MQKQFQVLAYPVDRLKTTVNPEIYQIPHDMLTASQAYWQQAAGPGLYNGSLARLAAWQLNGAVLEIDLELTDYRTQFYCNAHVNQVIERWGEQSLSRAMGISTVVELRDESVLMMKRSMHVGEYPGTYDVFGGHVEKSPEQHELPDVYQAMTDELEEELGLERKDIRIRLIGLIESIPNRKPELVFACNIAMDLDQVRHCANKARDRFEFDHIISVPYPYNGLATSPSAAGCLFLYREVKRREGQGGKRTN